MAHIDHQFPNTISGKGGNATPPSFKQNGFTTALPTVPAARAPDTSSPRVTKGHHSSSSGSPSGARKQGSSSSNSPRVARRQESGPSHSTSQVHHLTRIICNSLWGQKLTFHPYVSGESLVPFSSLWPDRRMMVDTFREAELSKRP